MKSTAGRIQYEVVDDGSEASLHAYLPEGFTSGNVVLTFEAKGHVSVFFETADGADLLGHVELPEYQFPEEAAPARYKAKLRRFTLRLLGPFAAAAQPEPSPEFGAGADASVLPAPALPDDDIEDDTFHDARPEPEDQQPGADAAAAASEPAFVDAEDGEAEAATELPSAAGEAPAEAPQPVAGGAAVADAPPAAGDAPPVTDHGGADAAASEKKKKKKKKKKKSGAAAGGAGATAGAEAEEDAEGDEHQPDVPPAAATVVAAPPGTPPPQQQPAAPAAAAAAPSPSKTSSTAATGTPGVPPVPPPAFPTTVPPAESTDPDVEPVDLEPGGRDFDGTATLGAAASPEAVAALLSACEPHGELLGPAQVSSIGAHRVKGEDASLLQTDGALVVEGIDGTAPFSIFGVFDGHGGKATAQYCTKSMVGHVVDALARSKGGAPEAAGGSAGPAATAAGVPSEVLRAWGAQEALIERLPKALYAAFIKADEAAQKRSRGNGSTATVAVLVGWELVVANVGDSAAFLDTGSHIVPLSANHRVDENDAEAQRVMRTCVREGGEYGTLRQGLFKNEAGEEGPDGPLRVWPGGLAMTRTIGDYEAGDILRGAPEVFQVTVPPTGARLIIASDGAWDALDYRRLIPQLREKTGAVAGPTAIPSLIKQKKSDDITLVVVDLCPPGERTVPVLLQTSLREPNAPKPVVWHPLSGAAAAAAPDAAAWRERLAAHRVAAMERGAAQRAAKAAADEAAAREAALRNEAAAAAAYRQRAAAAALTPRGSSGISSSAPLSALHKELMEVKVDLTAFGLQPSEQTSSSDWTPVGGGGSAKRSNKGSAPTTPSAVIDDTFHDASASFEEAAADHAESATGKGGEGRAGRGRSGRGPRAPVAAAASGDSGQEGQTATAGGQHPRADGRGGERRPPDFSTMVCRGCNKVGHRVAECPMYRKPAAVQADGAATAGEAQPLQSSPAKCSTCYGLGHVWKQCPFRGDEATVCQNFLGGLCNRGERCHYQHVVSPELHAQRESNLAQGLGPVVHYDAGAGGGGGGGRGGQRAGGGGQRDRQRDGPRGEGDGRHSASGSAAAGGGPAVAAAAPAADAVGAAAPAATAEPRGSALCRDFMNGRCLRSRCNFVHEQAYKPDASTAAHQASLTAPPGLRPAVQHAAGSDWQQQPVAAADGFATANGHAAAAAEGSGGDGGGAVLRTASGTNRNMRDSLRSSCWNCGQTGHVKADCPHPPDSTGSHRPERGGGRRGGGGGGGSAAAAAAAAPAVATPSVDDFGVSFGASGQSFGAAFGTAGSGGAPAVTQYIPLELAPAVSGAGGGREGGGGQHRRRGGGGRRRDGGGDGANAPAQ